MLGKAEKQWNETPLIQSWAEENDSRGLPFLQNEGFQDGAVECK